MPLKNKPNIKKIIKFFFGIPLTLLSFYFIGSIIYKAKDDIGTHLLHANMVSLVLGLGFMLLFFLLKAICWKLILQKLGHDVPYTKSNYLLSLGETKRYIPGNIFSFAARVQYFKEFDIPSKTVIKGLVVESFLLLFSSAVVSIPSIFFFAQSLLAFVEERLSISPIILLLLVFIISLFAGIAMLTFLKKKRISILSFAKFTHIFFIFVLAWIFFGIGNYLVAASFTSLSPVFFVQFASFFVFSWLIGYLSFVTPMGLGVREVVLTLGLTPFLPLSLASALSVILRIAFIASEVIFLVVTFSLTKITFPNHSFVKKIPASFLILLTSVISYISYFTYVSVQKYHNFFTGRFDLGNMDQTVWNTMHGKVFMLTNPDATESISRLAVHADFLLILLAPFYFIWPDARMLLVLQTVVIALGSIFVYLLAQRVIKNNYIALALSLSYLLNPLIQRQNLFDFHAVTFATTFLIAAFYFLYIRSIKWFLLFLFLAVLTKENVYLIAFFFGLYVIVKGYQKLGGVISITSLSIFLLLMRFLIPQARGSHHFALSYLSDFGDNTIQIITTIFLNPFLTFSKLLTWDSLHYLVTLLLSTGFLALLSPLFLIFALPDLTINLLSNNSNLRDIWYHYAAVILPFVYIATVFGIQRILALRWHFITPLFVFYYLLFFAFLSAWLYGPLPGARYASIEIWTQPRPNKELINAYLQTIPAAMPLAVSNNLGAHLSHRDGIYVVPRGLDQVAKVMILLDSSIEDNSYEADLLHYLLQSNTYSITYQLDNFYVFTRHSTAEDTTSKE